MKVGVLATTIAILLIAGLPFAATAGPATDMDLDGTADIADICKLEAAAPVPNGCDTDMDGYGNQCDPDFNNDGLTNLSDFGIFGASFGATGAPCSLPTDMSGDGIVNLSDFGLFGASFGIPPGPSGLPCAGTVPCP
jgi:hypothetical protein